MAGQEGTEDPAGEAQAYSVVTGRIETAAHIQS